MDDERLKNSGSILTKEYFEKQLAKIREIRLSERKFYQKITDIYATALDYDPSAKATKRFFRRFKTSFITVSIDKLLRRLYIIEQMQKKKIWGLQVGMVRQKVKFIPMMLLWRRII